MSNRSISTIKAYDSIATLTKLQNDPPKSIRDIQHYPGDYLIQLKSQPCRENPADSLVKKNLSEHQHLRVINYPGINVKLSLIPLLINARTELSSISRFEAFHPTAASYAPKYEPLVRYRDLLEYFKDENYIGRESWHIAKNILLPLAMHHQSSQAPIILKAFSMGGHELKMAFTYLIKILQSQGYTEQQIIQINEKFIIYTIGTSLNWDLDWSPNNPRRHLYPKILHILAIEDEGCIHPQKTRALLHDNPAVSQNPKESLIHRASNSAVCEVVIVPPRGKIRDTAEKDQCHNVNSYKTIIQESQFIPNLLRQAYRGDSEEMAQSWEQIVSNSTSSRKPMFIKRN